MSEFLLKSTLAMGVLLGLYYILFEREKMHRFNRFYLLSALVFSLALPLVTIPLYVEAEASPQALPMEQSLEFREQQMPEKNITAAKPKITITSVYEIAEPAHTNYWPYTGWGLYLTVATILWIRFILNIRRFYKNKRNSLTVSYKGTSLVLLSQDVLPHTFLNNIYVSKNEYENKLIAPELFTHELTHVKQFHTIDILFIETLKTMFWFNPLLYFYKKAIQLNHEFLADEKVIESTANTVYYQNLLLEKVTVGTSFSLASSLNFSLTKKRFIMMTKTTNKTKAVLMKFAVLPAITGLLYFLSTETVVLAKTNNPTVPEVKIAPEARIETTATSEVSGDSLEQQTPGTIHVVPNNPDTEARKNEYYKGVRIIIEDASKGKYIDKPYELLTAEERHYYLPDAPEKKGEAKGIQDADYTYSLYTEYNEQGGQFFLDDKKVSRDEILKLKKEDIAAFAAKSSGMSMVDGKLKGNHKSFFYTYPYYNKYLKSIYDHYPDKSLKIIITDKAEDYKSEYNEEAKATGKTELQIMEEREKKDLEATHYPTVEERKKQQRSFYPRFSGGSKEFDQYLANNLKLADAFKDKKLSIHFTVNTNGKLSDVWVAGEKDEQLLNEVKRVIENSPEWIPMQQNGVASKVGVSVDFPSKS
ncbi:M56 family metallopeptidase [Flavobacterium hauense]